MAKRMIPDDMSPWICVVNGVRYVYDAGTEQDVPDAVAHIIDAYWESREIPAAPGGGSAGGGGVMIVNLEGSSLRMDKTYAEIEAAISSGLDVRVVKHEEGYETKDWYNLNGTETGVLYFVSVKDLGLTGINISTMGIYSDDSVTIDDAEVSKNNPW